MIRKHVIFLVVFALLFPVLFCRPASAASGEWVIAQDITIKANFHVQSYGDLATEGKGSLAFGTSGEAKRLEGFRLELKGAPSDMEIRYGVHAKTYGDLPKDGLAVGPEFAGTIGEAKRLEGVRIGLYKKGTNTLYPGYQISYQVHMQGYGWGADANHNAYHGNEYAYKADGEFAGTKGEARRIEAVSLIIEKKAQ